MRYTYRDRLRRAVLLMLAVGALIVTQDARPSAEIEIPGVPRAALEHAGITLLSPDSTPEINREVAQAIAYAQAPTYDLPISQTVLVRLVDVNAGPPIDQLVWVNMVDLRGQPMSGAALFPSGNWIDPKYRAATAQTATTPQRSYHLIFIDAHTGEYIYALTG